MNITCDGTNKYVYCGGCAHHHLFNNTTEAVIDESVTVIGRRGFYGCQNLIKLTMHDNVAMIRTDAFVCCYSLKTISRLPPNLHRIGTRAFCSCSSLRTIQFPRPSDTNTEHNVTNVPTITSTISGIQTTSTLSHSDATNAKAGQISIGTWAFLHCSALEAIFLPSNVTRIKNGAFSRCKSLRFFHIPDIVTTESMGDDVAVGCDDLLIDAPVQYEFFGDQNVAMNSQQMNHWLKHRHNDCPLHKICYDVDVTVESIRDCIREQNANVRMDLDADAAVVDGNVNANAAMKVNNQGMVPLHILSANPYANAEMIRICRDAAPQAARMVDKFGCTFLHYLCEYNPSLLPQLDWPVADDLSVNNNTNSNINVHVNVNLLSRGCFRTCDREGMTPLQVLLDDGNILMMPLRMALRHRILWHEGMQEILQAVIVKNGTNGKDLIDIDKRTGLYNFMLAAESSVHAELSTVYELLLANPDPFGVLSSVGAGAGGINIEYRYR